MTWPGREPWISVKRFHLEKAKEYGSLKNYFQQNVIVRNISSAYIFECNGFADQYYKTILQNAWTIFLELRLSPKFSSETMLNAFHLNNINQSKSISSVIPFELLFRLMFNVAKLRIFGYSTHIRLVTGIQDWKRRSRPGIDLKVNMAFKDYDISPKVSLLKQWIWSSKNWRSQLTIVVGSAPLASRALLRRLPFCLSISMWIVFQRKKNLSKVQTMLMGDNAF